MLNVLVWIPPMHTLNHLLYKGGGSRWYTVQITLSNYSMSECISFKTPPPSHTHSLFLNLFIIFTQPLRKFLIKNIRLLVGGHFENTSKALVSVFFAQELPPVFSTVDSCVPGVSFPSHLLPSMKTYKLFNASSTHSIIK